jgi:hypothetical protein
MNVMIGPKCSLELFDRFEGTLQIQHWVATRDSCSSGAHCMALLNDFFPRRAPTLIGKHIW